MKRCHDERLRPPRHRATNRALRSAPPTPGVVRDENDSATTFTIERFHQLHDVGACCFVEVAGWFVGKENARRVHERARQRDPLLFTLPTTAAGK